MRTKRHKHKNKEKDIGIRIKKGMWEKIDSEKKKTQKEDQDVNAAMMKSNGVRVQQYGEVGVQR